MKNKIIAMTLVSMLAVNSLTINSFAETTATLNSQNNEMKGMPEKPKNEIFGKITAISQTSVTISVAEMKQPENIGNGFASGNLKEMPQDGFGANPPEKPQDGFGGNPPDKPQDGFGGNPPEMPQNANGQNNISERKELTEAEIAEMKKKFEENVTLTGETKTIDISNASFNDFGRGKRPEKGQNGVNAVENNSSKVEKTYKDYNVGDYIVIELTAENSTTAKSVRDATMMRGMRPQRMDSKSTNE